MSSSVANRALTSPDKALVSVRPAMAKADIPNNLDLVELSSVVKDTARRIHGKQGAAAAMLGKDEGNFARDVTAGRISLGDLNRLGSAFLAELGRELQDRYGQLTTPQQRYEALKRQRASIDSELDQFTESLL